MLHFCSFSNLGNTCYMNAILQALFHLEPFTRDLVHISRRISRSLPQQSLYQSVFYCYIMYFQSHLQLFKVMLTSLTLYFRSLVRLHGSRKRIVSDIAKRDLLRSVKQAISSSAKRFSGYQQHVRVVIYEQGNLFTHYLKLKKNETY